MLYIDVNYLGRRIQQALWAAVTLMHVSIERTVWRKSERCIVCTQAGKYE